MLVLSPFRQTGSLTIAWCPIDGPKSQLKCLKCPFLDTLQVFLTFWAIFLGGGGGVQNGIFGL